MDIEKIIFKTPGELTTNDIVYLSNNSKERKLYIKEHESFFKKEKYWLEKFNNEKRVAFERESDNLSYSSPVPEKYETGLMKYEPIIIKLSDSAGKIQEIIEKVRKTPNKVYETLMKSKLFY